MRIVVAGLFLVWWLLLSREEVSRVIYRGLPPVEANLLAGMLLGDRDSTKEEIVRLTNSGLVHLIVVSGSNVMLVVASVVELLSREIGRKRAIIVGLIGGWKYLYLVGWEIPVARAMLAVTIFYLVQFWGRKYDWMRAWLVVMIMIIGGEPRVVTSVSFWLSMTAWLGVELSSQVVRPWLVECRKEGWQPVVDTLIVNLLIWPILAMKFQRLNLWFGLGNLAVLAVVEMVTTWGMVAVVLGKLVGPVAEPLFWLVWPGLKYITWVSQLMNVPGMRMEMGWWLVGGYYFILFYLVAKVWESQKR